MFPSTRLACFHRLNLPGLPCRVLQTKSFRQADCLVYKSTRPLWTRLVPTSSNIRRAFEDIVSISRLEYGPACSVHWTSCELEHRRTHIKAPKLAVENTLLLNLSWELARNMCSANSFRYDLPSNDISHNLLVSSLTYETLLLTVWSILPAGDML